MMSELLLEEKELNEKLRAVEKAMQEPLVKLRKAKVVLDKAKAYFDQCLAEVRPLQSDKTLLEGELEIIAGKKSKLRQEARMMDSPGMRPGTQELVTQMKEIVGDPADFRADKASKAMAADQALAELKAKMDP
jgi:chromosome segregation ATPase